ncbi:uncharacterized protein METZ01_LOCUS330942, partial [marine metagenome]
MTRTLRQPISLRASSAIFLAFWCLLAAFPIFWITVMSFKEPVEAFSSNPLQVIFGPLTRARGKGLSLLDMAAGLALIVVVTRLALRWLPGMVRSYTPWNQPWLSWLVC